MFPQIYQMTGLKYFHSADLTDMKQAILDDGETGQKNERPKARKKAAQNQDERPKLNSTTDH